MEFNSFETLLFLSLRAVSCIKEETHFFFRIRKRLFLTVFNCYVLVWIETLHFLQEKTALIALLKVIGYNQTYCIRIMLYIFYDMIFEVEVKIFLID